MTTLFQSRFLTQTLKKVPEVTLLFWVIKLLTTAVGEVFSDLLVHKLHPTIAVPLGAIGFAITLLLQLSARKYIPWVYWSVVVAVAVFGTMAADVFHTAFDISYSASTVLFALALAAVFGVWYASEKTLSIHSITTTKRELFYWAAVITTFALGTAAGDMTANTLHLGYFVSGLMFAAIMAVIGFAYWRLGLKEIPAFWAAYIITRPLGASFADWAGKSQKAGGIGLGNGVTTVILGTLIIIAVAYLAVTHKDAAPE